MGVSEAAADPSPAGDPFLDPIPPRAPSTSSLVQTGDLTHSTDGVPSLKYARAKVPDEISDADFELFRKLVYDRSGISLNYTKKNMLCTRLGRILRRRHFESFKKYYEVAVGDPSGDEVRELIRAVSTNMTYFYREPSHFHYLENVLLPHWRKERAEGKRWKLRLWSAGCSTGEEPYSLAMSMAKSIPNFESWDIKILAVDISYEVLRVARAAAYPLERVHSVPAPLRTSWLVRGEGKNGLFSVHPALSRTVVFRELNLVQPAYPFNGRFDLIVCRNVMMYFDTPTQERLLLNFHKHLHPGGFLFLGHVETINTLRNQFRYVAPAIYQKAYSD